MTVTVCALSLIVPDPVEQFIPAFLLKAHENYNPVTKLNDIALIQVCCTYEDDVLIDYVLLCSQLISRSYRDLWSWTVSAPGFSVTTM